MPVQYSAAVSRTPIYWDVLMLSMAPKLAPISKRAISDGGISCQALAPKSDVLLVGGVKPTHLSPELRPGGQASVMNGFQTPDGKRSQALKSDSGLDGSGDEGWDFLVGTAISVYQNSGGINNNWWRYERQRTRLGRPTIDVSASISPLVPWKTAHMAAGPA